MPIEVLRPAQQTAPLVFASPHSGRDYPDELVASSRLDALALRRSEDAFMDEIFASAIDFGAPLLRAKFARAYVDPNREAFELDPAMFADELPDYVNTKSARVAAGLGTIARVVSNGQEIYHRKLRFAEAKRRIEACYVPYHVALRGLVDATRARFGVCLLVDCHSMPSAGHGAKRRTIDMVLGDRWGTACAPAAVAAAERVLRGMGLQVARNDPYAGGYTTRHYSNPKGGVHVLQVEINRALYMDETRIRPGVRLPVLCEQVRRFIEALVGLDHAILVPA